MKTIFGILFINVYLWIVQSVCQSSKYVRKRSKVSWHFATGFYTLLIYVRWFWWWFWPNWKSYYI